MSDTITNQFTELVPNLDAFNDDNDLMNLRREFILIKEAAKELATYCEARQHAIYFRKRGEIQKAIVYEKCCDELYAKLPEIAKSW